MKRFSSITTKAKKVFDIPDDSDIPFIFLLPAEIYVSAKPAIVTTVLGSCVSVTMYDPQHRIGGVCHGLLPYCDATHECDRGFMECFKNVDCSIRLMLEKLEALGAARHKLEVKMFGGAHVLHVDGENPLSFEVGRRNIAAAREVIEAEGLRLAAFDVGGMLGRKITFYTHTGEVLLSRPKAPAQEA